MADTNRQICYKLDRLRLWGSEWYVWLESYLPRYAVMGLVTLVICLGIRRLVCLVSLFWGNALAGVVATLFLASVLWPFLASVVVLWRRSGGYSITSNEETLLVETDSGRLNVEWRALARLRTWPDLWIFYFRTTGYGGAWLPVAPQMLDERSIAHLKERVEANLGPWHTVDERDRTPADKPPPLIQDVAVFFGIKLLGAIPILALCAPHDALDMPAGILFFYLSRTLLLGGVGIAFLFGTGLSFRRYRQGATHFICDLVYEAGVACFSLGLFLAFVEG